MDWIERYEIREGPRSDWAVVHIDSKGFFGVTSSYGNYAYHWTAFGEDFKKFLAGIDTDYLYGKLSGARLYDGQETLKTIKAQILTDRRSGVTSKDNARHEWNLLSEYEIDAYGAFGQPEFNRWCLATEMEEPWFFFRTTHCLQAMGFCQRLYPKFVEAMKKRQPAMARNPSGGVGEDHADPQACDEGRPADGSDG